MKILTIVGARPQFVKAAVVSRSFQKDPSFEEVIVHTGQHFDHKMSDIFFDEMNIPKPNYNLDINQVSHGAMTGRMIEKIEDIILKEKPNCLLVYGDTNSTLAGAIAAVKQKVKIAHVEAGLRSFNMAMPEEINRILTDRISSLLFCPTQQAVLNLKLEGFDRHGVKIENVGDVMYDAAMYYAAFSREKSSVQISDCDFVLVTIHRAENTDQPERLKNIIDSLNQISTQYKVILPLHPRTRKIISDLGLNLNFEVIEPVGYFDMLELLKNCKMVLTDSGGLQKEAYFFEKYCLTLRDETEWVELVESGVNSLVGCSKDLILSKFFELIDKNILFKKGLYGDSNAGSRVVSLIKGS
jgi:UDP-GlcNAc3NAcA epimerase